MAATKPLYSIAFTLYCTYNTATSEAKNQRSLQHEFSFYWLNLSLQEDSCIAKTEPDTSSSVVVIYLLKLHQNHDALKQVTGQ